MSTAFKIDKLLNNFFSLSLQDSDRELYESVKKEFTRQPNHVELIASENIVSKAVLDAQGSILTKNTKTDVKLKHSAMNVNIIE